MSKRVIWDLFGGGLNSVYNTLKENNLLNEYDIYTFDVVKPKHPQQYILDLSKDDVTQKLMDFPRPDIICASPLCQSFSKVMSMPNGTAGWELVANMYVWRSEESFEKNKCGFLKKCKYQDIHQRARLGWYCLYNTIKIIETFEPKYYYIENPKGSLMWKVIENRFLEFFNKSYINSTNYNNYGFLIKKPTTFLSNIVLGLIDTNKTNYTFYYKNGIRYIKVFDDNYNLILETKALNFRSGMLNKLNGIVSKKEGSETGGSSAIPHKLIKEILDKFKEWQW